MNRRKFISSALLGTFGVIAGKKTFADYSKNTSRPNFIFILVDDQRYDALGFMGKYPWLKTPNMDRLRAEGTHFKNAFVTHSICSPSRASFLTGVYSHVHGVVQNSYRDYDSKNCPSFAQILQSKNYKTGYIGKWHLGPGGHRRPGFDYWLSFDGQGTYFDPEYEENGKQHKVKGYTTDILNQKAVDFIKKQKADQPFALYLSHKAVHGPFLPAPRDEQDYSGEEVPKPESFDDNFETKPQWFAKDRLQGIYRSSKPGVYLDVKKKDRKWNPRFGAYYKNRSYTDYYRSLGAVDDGIGDIYSILKQKGILDNTVIILAGDNGFFLGEHDLLDKRLMFEESIRIPLLIRYPAKIKGGTTIEQLVLNIDLAPTILDMAGISVPLHMQGKSWVPLFEGNPAKWRKSFLYEYFVDLVPGIPTMVGIRTDRWKLIHYPNLNDIDELYDLSQDPYEMNNLAMVSKYKLKKQEMHQEMKKLMEQTGYNDNKWKLYPVTHKPAREGNGIVLHYDCKQIENNMLIDISGNKNNGFLVNTKSEISQSSLNSILKCEGKVKVSVSNSDSLIFKNGPFAVDVTIKPFKDGVVLARGGQINGFGVFIQNGVPSFGYRANGSLYIADGKNQYLNKKVRITGMVYNSKAHLYIDGKYVSSIPVSPYYFMSEPAENMQLGGDLTTGVLDGVINNGFVGNIYDLKLYNRQLSPQEITKL